MDACAEIIESSLNSWLAHCWEWDQFPPFGSLVTVNVYGKKLFGIVYQVKTGSSENGRSVYPFQKNEEQLRREHPQLFMFMKTVLMCVAVGYEQNGTIMYQLPPQPPKLHAFVIPATDDEYGLFFSSSQYVQVLFGAAQRLVDVDELLIALLSTLSLRSLLNAERFEFFMESFSLLTGNDYRRLRLFLRRVDPQLWHAL